MAGTGMDEQGSTKVVIFGQEYPIRAWADPEYIERVADHVDSRMKEVAEKVNISSTTKIAILAALNICDELFAERGRRIRDLEMVEDRAAGLHSALDEVLAVTGEGEVSETTRSAAGGIDSS
jgi:cell division protein ZapA